MKVSVIIPTHNRLQQLKTAYQSVCQQTHKPDEIIIVDDGSNIPLTCEDLFLEKYSITTIITRLDTSQGACTARNLGTSIATSDILMFLDDDDSWEENKIANQLKVFVTNSEIGLVYSGRLVVSENNRNRILYRIFPKAQGKLYPAILYDNLIGTTSSIAIKKNLFNLVGGFDETLPALQDYELWIRVSKYTAIAYDSSCSVRYTIAENARQQISGNPQKYITAGKIILNKHRQNIKEQGLINSCKIKSSLYFYVARYAKERNFWLFIWWNFKSFISYPKWKHVALLFPLNFIYFCKQSIFSKYKLSS